MPCKSYTKWYSWVFFWKNCSIYCMAINKLKLSHISRISASLAVLQVSLFLGMAISSFRSVHTGVTCFALAATISAQITLLTCLLISGGNGSVSGVLTWVRTACNESTLLEGTFICRCLFLWKELPENLVYKASLVQTVRLDILEYKENDVSNKNHQTCIPVVVGKVFVVLDLRPSTTETAFWVFCINLIFKMLYVVPVSTKKSISWFLTGSCTQGSFEGMVIESVRW